MSSSSTESAPFYAEFDDDNDDGELFALPYGVELPEEDNHALLHPSYNPMQNKLPRPHTCRGKTGRVVDSVPFRAVVILLVSIDALLLMLELLVDLKPERVAVITVFVLLALGVEVALRMVHMGSEWPKRFWNWFDFVVTLLSLIFTIALSEVGRFFIILRYLRVIRVFWNCYRERKSVPKALRQKISANRTRYQDHDFDIDVTYITDRLIAMSVPAVKVEALYRNPVNEVARFFNTKHTDHYVLYNLCPERKYPYDKFHNRVHEWFMQDHNPAPLPRVQDVCADIDVWLRSDPRNVAAIHCKGGKGRTGTVLCSYLLYSRMVTDGQDALDYFSTRRTSPDGETLQGVDTPSQARYVNYFARMMREGAKLPAPRPVAVTKIVVYAAAAVTQGVNERIWFTIARGGGDDVYDFGEHVFPLEASNRNDDTVVFRPERNTKEFRCVSPDGPPVIDGDVKITFWHYVKDKKKQYFCFWWHTAYEESPLVLERTQVDGAHKKKHAAAFTDAFRVEVRFAPVGGSDGSGGEGGASDGSDGSGGRGVGV